MLQMTKIYKPKKLILTAGPSISKLEERYVLDAVRNGWNEHFADYQKRFEEAFAAYIGVKYAWTTSSGTGALHSGLMALGIGKGDEVIIPEITFVASANVVSYVGAKPVFADVEKDTWCLNPRKLEQHITKKTKAVMPVHIYGHPTDMDPVRKIAKKYSLFIIEDACPSVGAEYKREKTGSLSDVAAFSFQGAKIMVTGEGGILVTNNKGVYEKAKYWGNNCKSSKLFWHDNVGYMYRMSNLLAALGLGQLERNNEFVEKKRQIFKWYHERLGDIEGLSMNVEKEWAKNIFWMSSIVLDKDFGITRDQLMAELKKRLVDTRPFFYPLSIFPMYNKPKVNNPVAYHVGLNGINLPSGVLLTEEKVDYIAQQVRDILLKK